MLESPWPAAVGFPALPGRKSNQFLHGRDFLFYTSPTAQHKTDLVYYSDESSERVSFHDPDESEFTQIAPKGTLDRTDWSLCDLVL